MPGGPDKKGKKTRFTPPPPLFLFKFKKKQTSIELQKILYAYELAMQEQLFKTNGSSPGVFTDLFNIAMFKRQYTKFITK